MLSVSFLLTSLQPCVGREKTGTWHYVVVGSILRHWLNWCHRNWNGCERWAVWFGHLPDESSLVQDQTEDTQRQLNWFFFRKQNVYSSFSHPTIKTFLIWKEIPFPSSEKSDLDGSRDWQWRTWRPPVTFFSTLCMQTWLYISTAYCK